MVCHGFIKIGENDEGYLLMVGPVGVNALKDHCEGSYYYLDFTYYLLAKTEKNNPRGFWNPFGFWNPGIYRLGTSQGQSPVVRTKVPACFYLWVLRFVFQELCPVSRPARG